MRISFCGDDDYIQYLQWVEDYCRKYSLKIWAYCLMSNHEEDPLTINKLALTLFSLMLCELVLVVSKFLNAGDSFIHKFYDAHFPSL